MKVMFIIAGVLFALTAVPSIFFFALYLSTGEHVPRERAVALYRWSVVIALGSFNVWIFNRVIQGIRALM